MKALCFLQIWHATAKERFKYDNWLKTLYEEHFNLSNWSHLLAQPFKPEMITEHFEGWEKGDGINIFYFEGTEIDFVYNNYLSYTHYSITSKHGYSLPIPRTLDEFITDCQRAGIKLELKEQK